MAKPARSSLDSPNPAAVGPFWTGPYWYRSQRPLEILVLLAPLIVVYELGLLVILQQRDGVLVTNLAHKYIIDLFSAMGITGFGLALPGLLLVILLLVWQVLSRYPWIIHWGTIGLMWIESLILVIPISQRSCTQVSRRWQQAFRSGRPSPSGWRWVSGRASTRN
jgi:hypothetical protein